MDPRDALWEPRKLRDQYLANVAELIEQYMRSPAFLACLHYGLTVTTARRALVRQLLALPHHRGPLAAAHKEIRPQ